MDIQETFIDSLDHIFSFSFHGLKVLKPRKIILLKVQIDTYQRIIDAETFWLRVKWRETYIRRIVNVAPNVGHYLKIARHKFIAVDIDAYYTKQHKIDVITISTSYKENDFSWGWS